MRFEDLPEQVQNIMARREMEQQAAIIQIENFLFDHDKDGMLALAGLLGMIASAGVEAASIANYYEGMVRGTIRERWQVCPTHGVDHESDALAKLQGSTETRDTAHDESEPEIKRMELVAQIMDDLQQYRVGFTEDIDVDTDESDESLRANHPVSCVNCGHVNPSLNDRMLKKPDDCVGCHLKSAHG